MCCIRLKMTSIITLFIINCNVIKIIIMISFYIASYITSIIIIYIFIIIYIIIFNIIFIIYSSFIIIKIINFNLLNIYYFNNIYTSYIIAKRTCIITSTSFSISFSTLWRCKFTAFRSTFANVLTTFMNFYCLDTIVKTRNKINNNGASDDQATSPVEEIDDNALIPASRYASGAAIHIASLVKLS